MYQSKGVYTIGKIFAWALAGSGQTGIKLVET